MLEYNTLPIVSQPRNLAINLFQHQLASIGMMEKREAEQTIVSDQHITETNIGINADITGYGKCNAINTPIIMHDCTIKMVQDIKVGDKLLGDDSKPRTVLSLCRGKDYMYKIKQNGNNYIVNKEHTLSLKICTPAYIINNKSKTQYYAFFFNNKLVKFNSKTFPYNANNELTVKKIAYNFLSNMKINPYVDIELRYYLKLPESMKRRLRGYKVKVDFPEKQVNIDPYILGQWLGNENKVNYSEIIDLLNSYNLTKNKHIPHIYIHNSAYIRQQLFFGFLDSVGSIKNNTYEIIINNKQLAADFIFLSRSLGYRVKNIKNKIVIYNIPNKNICSNINIIPLGVNNYYGFTLDGNHRYLLGDFTVTHNSLSFVGLILRDKMEWDCTTPYAFEIQTSRAGGRIKTKKFKLYTRLPTTLIVASQSIVSQWAKEFEYTKLRVITITKQKETLDIDPENFDVIIVSSSMYNILVSKFKTHAWKRFIFDEPSHIRIPGMREIIAGFYWFVTATPNKITSLHSKCKNSFMMQILGQDVEWYDFETIFAENIIKNDDRFVQASFQMPATTHKYYECYQPLYKTMIGMVNKNILNMISAGNISGAIKMLGGSNTKNIVELTKNKKLEELEEIISKIKIYTIRNDTDRIAFWSDKQKHLENQIEELNSRFDTMLSSTCSICYELLSDPVIEPACDNAFCGKCLLTALSYNKDCPVCRSKIDTTKLIYIGEASNDKLKKPKTKNQYLTEIILSSPNGKFIVFSSWDETFDQIRCLFDTEQITYTEIKGTAETRTKNITNFKEGRIQVIFLNSGNNGSGINLQEATDIILYHTMSKDTMTQIMGRANRIGRQIPLTVHHLLN